MEVTKKIVNKEENKINHKVVSRTNSQIDKKESIVISTTIANNSPNQAENLDSRININQKFIYLAISNLSNQFHIDLEKEKPNLDMGRRSNIYCWVNENSNSSNEEALKFEVKI